jgi:hypothetical protein
MVIVCASALLVCSGLTSSARATIVDVNQEAYMMIEPSTAITCIAYFIPDVPNVPGSLMFPQPPQWTDMIPFDHEAAGWNTALADGNKTVYIFGPEIANTGPSSLSVFSYKLYYQWDDGDPNYNPSYPVYLDTVVFDGGAIVSETARRGTLGSYETNPGTWQEEYGGPPYENPAPEPMTICLLGLGAAFLRKRR